MQTMFLMYLHYILYLYMQYITELINNFTAANNRFLPLMFPLKSYRLVEQSD